MIIHLNDYLACSKSQFMYLPDDMAYLRELWKSDTSVDLDRLQDIPVIRGYTTWSDLTPNHYRILVTHVLNMFGALNDSQRSDRKNPVTVTLHRVIYFFILKLENVTDSEIEHFRVNRFTAMDVTFDYGASFDIHYPHPVAREGDAMRIVIPDVTP